MISKCVCCGFILFVCSAVPNTEVTEWSPRRSLFCLLFSFQSTQPYYNCAYVSEQKQVQQLMASTLRKRLKRRKDRQQSPSLSAINPLPVEPVDLGANSIFFGTSPCSHLASVDTNRDGFLPKEAETADADQEIAVQALPPSVIPPLLVLVSSIFLLFISRPDDLLRALLSLLLFAPYPPWFRRWTILVALFVPMTTKGRVQVVIFLGMQVWIHVG